MATDDISLRVGRLEIEPLKSTKILKEDNPFVSSIQKKNSICKIVPLNKCSCYIQKNKHSIIYKRKPNKILREPVLKLSQCHSKSKKSECQQLLLKGNCIKSPILNAKESIYLHTLVNTCNQLHISSDNVKSSSKPIDVNDRKWWKNDSLNEKQYREHASDRNASSSCSQQALNPPCDVTIDELASYFETLVHIPKKMSSMAEMMYI